ncbi:uncharacterized protein LACBIDRAFT_311161 [Laccaria bicolor S238N-H82]|uniref:Predicted protein n=1 Tax=Laccaria bicolor (strain S238N-H82 / ATCC MYA-4686) TaxID=486041 RepID=B0CZD4_LACBS|nr:uncharacterized protein LACBIDRAFT_311161 [Laccaria bicolor S238N-H82]EDR12602.1 predicted protein [Laccaria bicolor S238N-H82]|eukprot:XP_001876866.1 predicted protein [Laccaria bicolor S238N-H82]
MSQCLEPETGLYNLLGNLLTNSPLSVTAVSWKTGSSISKPNAVAFRSVLKGFIMAIVELVPVEVVPEFDALVGVWIALFGRSESSPVSGICRQFWEADFRTRVARRAIFDKDFPYNSSLSPAFSVLEPSLPKFCFRLSSSKMNKRALDADDIQVAAVAKKCKVNQGFNVQPGDHSITSNDDRNQLNSITTESLQQLLDFSHLSDEQCIKARFDVVANALLRDFHFVLKCENVETEFQILELNFYLQKAGCHEDPHGGEEQKICARWYFHRPPRRSADSNWSATSLTDCYRGGSRKGMDVTIGGPSPSITTTSPYFAPSATTPSAPGPSNLSSSMEIPPLPRGGILLRSIRKLGPKPQVISGHSLLVDQILLLSRVASISELIETKWAGERTAFIHSDNPGADTPSYKLYLKHSPHSPGLKIYNSPRIGLDLSHPGTTGPEVKPLHSRIRFLPKRYRYFTNPSKLVANGRTQTFLGVLYSCIFSPSNTGLCSGSLRSPP